MSRGRRLQRARRLRAHGWTLEAAVVGSGVSAIAGEVAAKKVAKVYDVEYGEAGALHSGRVCACVEGIF